MWPEQQQTLHAESNLNNLLRQESAANEDEDVQIQSELPNFGSAHPHPYRPRIPDAAGCRGCFLREEFAAARATCLCKKVGLTTTYRE